MPPGKMPANDGLGPPTNDVFAKNAAGKSRKLVDLGPFLPNYSAGQKLDKGFQQRFHGRGAGGAEEGRKKITFKSSQFAPRAVHGEL